MAEFSVIFVLIALVGGFLLGYAARALFESMAEPPVCAASFARALSMSPRWL